MLGDLAQVIVGVEHLGALPEGDRRYEAVDKLSDGGPPPPARPVDLGGVLVVGGPPGREELAAAKEPAQVREVSVVSGPGQHLHEDGVGGGELSLLAEKAGEPPIHSGAGGPEVLHPHGCVDQYQNYRCKGPSPRHSKQGYSPC